MAPLRGLPFLIKKGQKVALTPPALDRDRFCSVMDVSHAGSESLVSFSGIDSLSLAEKIIGCMVLAQEDDLDLNPLTSSVDDIIGREVIDSRYGSVGTVVEVMCTPANDVWVVDGSRYGEVLIPVIPDVVESIPDEGCIRVDLLDGLIEEPFDE